MSAKDDILENCIQVLNEPYETAKQMHIKYESQSLTRDWKGLVNFRDALDHLSDVFAAIDNENFEKAEDELGDAKSHLGRASYESAQALAEDRIAYLEENKLPSILYKITWVDGPDEGKFEEGRAMIRNKIERGRNRKENDWRAATSEFKEASDKAKNLKQELPPKGEVYFRLVVLVLSIAALLIGGISIILNM